LVIGPAEIVSRHRPPKKSFPAFCLNDRERREDPGARGFPQRD
jgi:hypothetical protein